MTLVASDGSRRFEDLLHGLESRLGVKVGVEGGSRAPPGSQAGDPRDGIVELP